MFEQFGLTSLAMVVMKAGGRAVAMRERAWRAERAESAGGLRGKPMVMLERERVRNIYTIIFIILYCVVILCI